MSRQSKMNQVDENRECELCKAYVLKSQSGCFGILQNCENVFCLECASIFSKVETLSKRNAAKVGYYVCPICGKKSYMLASSYYFVADPEEKKVFFDEYLKSTGSFICEVCKVPRSNCSHSIHDEKKPALKFGMESNHLLSPEMLLERSQACKVKQNHQSFPISGAYSYNSSALNNNNSPENQASKITTSGVDKNCIAPESSSSEIDVFSAEDFPLLDGKNIETVENFPSTTERGEPGRKLYSQVSQENDLTESQIELVPFVHLPFEYTKQIPDECRIETASSLPFLPEDVVPIYTTKELQARYDKSSLKAMNLHHVFKNKYIRQNMQDVRFFKRFLASNELFSIRFSSSSADEDSVVKLWSANGATGSSTARPKYPALSSYLAQLEMMPSEKTNPLIPIIKFATNLAPVSQDQNRKRVERVCTRLQNLTVQQVNITDNCYGQLDMESQLTDSLKIIHIMFHEKSRNIHNHKESETRCNLEGNILSSANTEICHRQDSLTSSSEEVSQSKYKPLPVSFSSSIQTLSSDLTSDEFHFPPKYKSASNGGVLLRSELEKKHSQSVKELQEQPNNNSTMQLDYKTRGQDDYFLTTYLHPYQQIISVRCKMESQENFGTNLIRYYHVEPRAEDGLSPNPSNAAEGIDYANSQRKEDQTYAQLKLLSRLQTSYKETQTIFFREEMNRFGSGEITFGNNFPRNCNVQSLTESPVFRPLENAFPPIQNPPPPIQNKLTRRRSSKKQNSEKQGSFSETTFQSLQNTLPPIQNQEMRRRTNINQNSEKQVSSETTFQSLQNTLPPIQNQEMRRRTNINQNSQKQVSSSETTFQSLQNTLPPIQNQEMHRRTNINQNSEKQVSSSETASGQADKENKKIQ